MREPPAPGCQASDDLVFRRGRLRKREDDEVRMMREALANLDDAPRVRRTLLELGRFYNPVTHGPVLGPETRHAVMARLDAGDLSTARALLEAHLHEYLHAQKPGVTEGVTVGRGRSDSRRATEVRTHGEQTS